MNLVCFIKEVLTEDELSELRGLIAIDNIEARQSDLRKFFTKKEIFDKVKLWYDPTWVSYEIFINKGKYEF
jgi:hypothetical protein